MRGGGGAERLAEFERFYTARYTDIAGYVRRRVAPDESDDVIAHIFTVAWRRFDLVPPPPQDRLWLFGVARNSVADHDRSRQRRSRLRARLAQDAVIARPEPAVRDPRLNPVTTAINALPPAEREALQLVLWDELTHAEAAAVAGCSVNALEIRYRRARNAVRAAVENEQANARTGSVRSFPSSAPVRRSAS